MIRFMRQSAFLLVVWAGSSAVGAAEAPAREEPYRDLGKAGAGFHGGGRETPDPEGLKTIRIGLTGPARSARGRALQAGARLALEQANEDGGWRGTPFELVFAPDDGPWGTAAKVVVRLTYEDEVWAIIASVDGAHAHLAELIAAKAWIPILTPAASDSSIDYANVPWVFRLMPDDAGQARLLLRLARERGAKRLAVLTEGERDARHAWEILKAESRRQRFPVGLRLEYSRVDPRAILDRIIEYAPDALLVWGLPEGALSLINALRDRGIEVPVFGPATLATPSFARDVRGPVTAAAPYDVTRSDPALDAFRRLYREREGDDPDPVAIFAYDGVRVIVDSIRRSGVNRARIRDALAAGPFRGLSGPIHFNPLGGNPAPPVIVTVRDGRWVRPDAVVSGDPPGA